jgi:hypothetical protein
LRNAMAIGALAFCAIAPIYATAKTVNSTCEQRCREYYCHYGASRELYCHYECHKKCTVKELSRTAAEHSCQTERPS